MGISLREAVGILPFTVEYQWVNGTTRTWKVYAKDEQEAESKAKKEYPRRKIVSIKGG